MTRHSSSFIGWLLVLASVASGQGIEISSPQPDARVSMPQVMTWPVGKAVDVRSSVGNCTWAILAPETLTSAWAVDDTTLRLVMPRATVRILMDFGDRSKLVVIKPTTDPGPAPDPVDPVDPVVVPDGWQGFTRLVYQSAKAAKLTAAAASKYQAIFAAVLARIDAGEWKSNTGTAAVHAAYQAVDAAARVLTDADAGTKAIASAIEAHSETQWTAGRMRSIADARSAFSAIVDGLGLIAEGK